MSSSWRRSALAVFAAVSAVVPVLALAAPATAAPVADVKINEVESSGGTPGDWVELINNGTTDADIGGWVVKDNDDTHSYTIPSGTTITAGGYYVVDTDLPAHANPFGLGGADSARLYAPGVTDPVDSYTWTTAATVTYGRCPNGTGGFVDTAASTKGAANSCPATTPNVKINEVESNDGTNPDWIELINNATVPADIGGWVVKDSDDTHAITLPSGTTVAPGGYFVINTDDPNVTGNFGLGTGDSARLFTAGAASLVDSYTWTQHAAVTYGRCPNGTGGFVDTRAATKGAANSCPGDPLPWPGGPGVAIADGTNVLGTNMSGLAYQPSGTSAPGVLWAVKNAPSMLFRLVWDGTKWTPDTTNGWAAGKGLHYPDGTGDPDAEGVTLIDNDPANGVYVSTERNNANGGVSRPAVLRFDVSGTTTSLNATNDWNLTSDLPGLAPNSGLEAIQWMSDGFLVSKGFKDEATNATYSPASYPNHGPGLFFVGVEQNGNVDGYALKADGSFTRVATISTGFPAGVMELEFEPETTHLWAVCDDTCGGRHETLDISPSGPDAGKFVITNVYARPAGMPNFNNEGFAISPRAECLNGLKPVFWADDTNDDLHALRSGTINCTPRATQTITFPQPAALTVGGSPVALAATASSGLPVAYAVTGPCALTGATLSATTGSGTCTVTASQAGSADFLPAADAILTVAVQRAGTTLAPTPVSLLRSLLTLRVTYTAKLTSTVTGQPIAGQTVSFATNSGRVSCTAVTGDDGVATCTTPLLLGIVNALSGTAAKYAGSSAYEPSSSPVPTTLF